MSLQNPLPRRTFLRGLGTAMALPMLPSLISATSRAAALQAETYPTRMAFIFVPNGVNMEHWEPKKTGADFTLPYVLEPLAPVKKDLLVLSGLTHDKGRANGDGPGDHARSAGVYLTGTQPLKSEGSEIRAGVSVDQYAAQRVGHLTRFPSIEIGTEESRSSGKCDSGYSCAYSNNISWRNETTPVPKEDNPRLVFERLFANELSKEVSESQTRRRRYRKSILDFVISDARSLTPRLNGNDRNKLDEYLTSVREIEQRVERAERENESGNVKLISSTQPPDGIPASFEEHVRLMGDMMILAFQADVTRICSFMFANAGSNKSYSFIGVPQGHHSLSHHQNNPDKLERIAKINRFHVAQLSYILQKMASIREGAGTLLDHSMIVYGSAISDGNRHNNENLPVLVAGRGNGTILPGRHVKYREETPMSNLFVSMLERMNVPAPFFADSTGTLSGLVV